MNPFIRRPSEPAKSEGAAALAFAREGHRIVVAGRREEAGQELVTELRALGTAESAAWHLGHS